MALDENTQTQVPEAVNTPVTGGQNSGGFYDWWSRMAPEQKSSLQQAALTTGLSMMAQGPSRYPVSATEVIGNAGLKGLQSYNNSMENYRKAGLERRDLELKEASNKREEALLGLKRQESEREAAQWAPGEAPTYEDVVMGDRPKDYAASMNDSIGKSGLPMRPQMPSYQSLRDEKGNIALSTGKGLPRPALGESVTEQRMVKPGKQGGIMYRKTEAEIEGAKAKAMPYTVENGHLVNKQTGEYVKLNTAKEYAGTSNAGGHVIIHYKDGTRETVKKTVDPSEAGGSGKVGSAREHLLWKMIKGEKFSDGDNKAWDAISQEEKILNAEVVKTLQKDPEFAYDDEATQRKKISATKTTLKEALHGKEGSAKKSWKTYMNNDAE